MSAPDAASSNDAAPSNDASLRGADERTLRAIGSALFAVVAASYLAFLAVGVLAFRGRPFVGGAAAVFAIALSRVLQWTIAAKMERRAAR